MHQMQPNRTSPPLYTIMSRRLLAETIAKFEIYAPLIAKKRRPGNFVMVRATDNGERIPLTLVDSDNERGTITLIIQAVGKTTKHIFTLYAGDQLLDVVGPLGNSTPMTTGKTVICIGGGVGTAELFPITRGLKEHGNTIHTIIGGRTRELVILEEEMRSCSDRVYVTTDDGSYGRRGTVVDQLNDLMASVPDLDAVYAIGPLPMMKAVANATRPSGLETVVSMNALMVDGTGMCGGCRVSVGGEMKFACVDGPEFDGHKVDFDELIMRNRTYSDLEKLSDCRV
jgi:ferredoxin--NADP+ reductase